MRFALTAARLFLAAFAVLVVVPSSSFAAEPPNPNDPCSRAGRNTCGTLGVGFYDETRYGTRWLGDFRGVIAGKAPLFCLDSRFWYASPAYKYRPARSGALRNRDGELVPRERQRRIAYALWTYGRSSKPNQQAAVALYVHALVGDGRSGEVDPGVANPRVAALYEKIAADAARFHGPYTIEARIAKQVLVGKAATVTVRVLSAAGHSLPNVPLRLTAGATATAPAELRTGQNGVAVVPLTATAAGRSSLRVETAPLAATLPTIFRATTKGAAASAQRLAAPASQRVSAKTTVTARAVPTVGGATSTQIVPRGNKIFDRVRVRGLGKTTARMEVELFGPFETRSVMRCEGRPRWSRSLVVNGDTALRTPAVRLDRPGFYTYRERLVGSRLVDGSVTECATATSTSLVAPPILAGGADTAGDAAAPDARGSRPVRARLASVGISAPVLSVGIDLRRGALGTPKNIRQAGWWKDGSAPGATSGAVLIVGHVDSARGGAGAFFSLRRARAGDEVQLRTADGRTFRYRVTTVRAHAKNALPTSIYSTGGAPRLVLVTCGGPFDGATGSYRDNLVVTAVPA
jgi:Sortase domain